MCSFRGRTATTSSGDKKATVKSTRQKEEIVAYLDPWDQI